MMAIVIQFLFPSDYFNMKKPDEGFVDQMSCFRSDGVQRIVEIGDKQVSDLVGWTAERFVQLWG